MGRKKSAVEWAAIIREWETSGQSCKRFCRNKKIPLSTFGYWKRKLAEQGGSVGEQALVAVARPIVINSSTGGMSLVVSERYRFEWEHALAMDVVLALIDGLESRR